MKSLPIAFLIAIPLAACSGGGGGGGVHLGPGAVCDPGDYRPMSPPGLGVSGRMDGTWRAVTVTLVSDPRTRNPDVDQAYILPDSTIDFRDGLVFEGDEEPTAPTDPHGVAIPVTIEFYCNEVDGSVTLHGFGIAFGPNPYTGPGTERMVAVFGTTGATTATALIVEETALAGGQATATDRFQVVRVDLEKVTSFAGAVLGAELPPPSASDGGVAGGNGLRRFVAAARRPALRPVRTAFAER